MLGGTKATLAPCSAKSRASGQLPSPMAESRAEGGGLRMLERPALPCARSQALSFCRSNSCPLPPSQLPLRLHPGPLPRPPTHRRDAWVGVVVGLGHYDQRLQGDGTELTLRRSFAESHQVQGRSSQQNERSGLLRPRRRASPALVLLTSYMSSYTIAATAPAASAFRTWPGHGSGIQV